jgi:GntR family transcriptional regulator, transcriptional repressor for pyruvate dehydrogenase complex
MLTSQSLPTALSQLEPIEHTTAAEAVTQKLIGLLNQGILKPGDQLPPERELATQLNVGRTTVREALKLLSLSGLLEVRRGSGTYVRSDYSSFVANQMHWPALLNPQDIDAVFEVREALEVQSARLAALRATSEEIAALAVHRRMATRNDDLSYQINLDTEFHQAIARGAHNPLLLSLMLSIQNLLHQYVGLSIRHTADMSTTLVEHEAICEAIAARNPDRAVAAMADHLRISRAQIFEAPGTQDDH